MVEWLRELGDVLDVGNEGKGDIQQQILRFWPAQLDGWCCHSFRRVTEGNTGLEWMIMILFAYVEYKVTLKLPKRFLYGYKGLDLRGYPGLKT